RPLVAAFDFVWSYMFTGICVKPPTGPYPARRCPAGAAAATRPIGLLAPVSASSQPIISKYTRSISPATCCH
ncbi:MAG: hypothetical protein WBQ87_10560, partial [Candidatus Sulfotelmatobacter sp.]